MGSGKGKQKRINALATVSKSTKEVAHTDDFFAFGQYFHKGDIIYSLNKEIHREDGPALILTNGDEQWWQYGKPHRLDGPAIIHGGSKTEYYFINGDQLGKEEYYTSQSVIDYANAKSKTSADLASNFLRSSQDGDHIIRETLLEISKSKRVNKEQLDYLILEQDPFMNNSQIELLKKISIRKTKEQELLSDKATVKHNINF